MAAAAAIIGGVRCHDWQRPLPIMSPPAANQKGTVFFPASTSPVPNLRWTKSAEVALEKHGKEGVDDFSVLVTRSQNIIYENMER